MPSDRDSTKAEAKSQEDDSAYDAECQPAPVTHVGAVPERGSAEREKDDRADPRPRPEAGMNRSALGGRFHHWPNEPRLSCAASSGWRTTRMG